MKRVLLAACLLLFALPSDSRVTGGRVTGGRVFASSTGSSCTDGVDCYCDEATADPDLRWCEDFEHPSFYEKASDDFSASSGTNTGSLARWTTIFGTGSCSTIWTDGQPTTQRWGPTCDVAPGPICGSVNPCAGTKEYVSTAQGNVIDGGGADAWGANATATVDIQRTGDYNHEVSGMTLSGGAGVSDDIGGKGRQHLYSRTPQGIGNTGGFHGAKTWTPTSNVGIAVLLAFSSNYDSADIAFVHPAGGGAQADDNATKGDEFGSFAGGEFSLFGHSTNGGVNQAQFPFRNFFWWTAGNSCAAVSGASVTHGNLACIVPGAGQPDTLQFFPTVGTGANQFTRLTHFPPGQWRCVRMWITGMGTSAMRVRKWHDTGKGTAERLIIDFTIDATNMGSSAYGNVGLNNYTNNNASGQGSGTLAPAGFYRDNYHVRVGEPPSCDVLWSQVPFDVP